MIWCCKGCEDRHYACHGHCEKYIQQKAEHERLKAEANHKSATNAGLNGHVIATIDKANRRYGNRRTKGWSSNA